MRVELSSDLSEIIARAFSSGVETSIDRLAVDLGYGDLGRLAAASKVVDFVTRLHLEFVPDVGEFEYESLRVLRAAEAGGSAAGRVAAIISEGEGAEIEFKSSMLCSVRDWSTKNELTEFPSLPGEILKTICAFLNTDGGDLLVGVDDAGASCGGISLDMQLKKWNLDKWQLHFQALVKDRFYDGHQVQPYLRSVITEIDSHPVFHVSVMSRAQRSFVQREKGKAYEFFVRNGPRTDGLDLPGFYNHMRNL